MRSHGVPSGREPPSNLESNLDSVSAVLTSPGSQSDGTDPHPDTAIAIPERLGRYVVLHRVGSGGMGVVYAAYDPELDRKVAIKVLLSGAGSLAVRERLLREAQVMARLSHPNVVVVFDVGTVAEHVFIAMEFVQGETLRRWIKRERNSWRSTLAMFVQAGRGLAAAHDSGIIHRDFKPDNVLIDERGRARVTDFGLARATTDPTANARPADAPNPLGGLDTRDGTMIGTPSYMAPEQFAGVRGDAQSDQFAFCVALWEGLFGKRPFDAENLLALAAAVTRGELQEPPRGSGVPRWLQQTVLRGLAHLPRDRWPSMDALLGALERGQSRARLRRALTGVAAAAGCAVGLFAAHQLGRAQTADACDEAGAGIAVLWYPERRVAIREALVATATTYAATTAQKLMPWLDEQAAAWRSARTEVCLDTELRGRLDANQSERALGCLDERWMELESLLDELGNADTAVVQRAVGAAAGLTAVASCRDADRLSLTPSPPLEQREAIRELRRRLWRGDAAYQAGKAEAAIALLEPLLTESIELGWPQLTTEVRARLAKAYLRRGDHELARDALIEAYVTAADIGAPQLAGAAAAQLVYVLGLRLAKHDDAFLWGRLAEIELRRLGSAEDLPWATLYGHLSMVHQAAGHDNEALAFGERALAIRESTLGSDHPEVAGNLHNLSTVHRTRGDNATAQAFCERALAIQKDALGDDHPDVAKAMATLANVYSDMGDHAAALVIYERALAIQEQAYGPQHFEVAKMLGNIGTIRYHMRAYEEALRDHRRALAIAEVKLGPEHPDVATMVSNVGIAQNALGAHAEALATHRRALAIREKTLGPDHPMVAVSLINLAGGQRDSMAIDDALATYARALTLIEAKLGASHPHAASCLDGIARAQLMAGRAAAAIDPAERALAIREATHEPPLAMAETQFELARALGEGGGDAKRARALADTARDVFATAGAAYAKDLAETDAWLASR